MATGSLTAAPLATDLQISRRLALGLMGTVPSLEEIRQLESVHAEQRSSWWLDRILKIVDSPITSLSGSLVPMSAPETAHFSSSVVVALSAWLADALAQNRLTTKLSRN